MLSKIGRKFTDLFQRNMPDAYVFALVLTLLTALLALIWAGAEPIVILESWYTGFWTLLEFGMQMVLLIITGYSVALSPIVSKGIDHLAKYIKTPIQVYFFSIFIGVLLSMVSYGWIVITAVLARELALRVKGVNYPFLIACVYFSGVAWVTGLSSSIPLLLNTEGNYLIEAGILTETISTSSTLGSFLNISMMIMFLIISPILMVLLRPKNADQKELGDLLLVEGEPKKPSIAEEAENFKLPYKALSDQLNNSALLHIVVAMLGIIYLVYYFATKGMELNLNIMIFLFLMLGMILHRTPIRYSISMKRASGNVSGILFQFPFYAGIMGIMTYTGLGERLAGLISSFASIETYPVFAFLLGGIVNFAIPSGGGEFAVIGPSVIEAVQNMAEGLPTEEVTTMIARASLSIAYGESLTNMLQPFFLLLVLPVMGAGIKIQARDIMGYLVVPFVLFFAIEILMVMFIPL